MLARAHRAFDHRIDRLQVRRIEGQREVHRSAGRHHVRRESLVVLDVAGGKLLRLPALEFGKEVGGHLAESVDQHGEAAAMRHADHRLLHACRAGLLDQMVEHRDQRVAAFPGKALLPDVLRVQVALQRFRRREPLEDVAPLLRRVNGPRADRLETLLDEALHRRVRDVHVLGAEGAAVGVLQRLHEVAQAHALGPRLERADVELGVEIGVGEAVGGKVEVGDVPPFLAFQRVELGVEHAEGAELADHLQHQHLLVHRAGVDHRARDLAALAQPDERFDDRGMGDVGGAAAQRVEVDAPVRGDGIRIGEVVLVLLLDERHVAAEQRAGGLEFAHVAHRDRLVYGGRRRSRNGDNDAAARAARGASGVPAGVSACRSPLPRAVWPR